MKPDGHGLSKETDFLLRCCRPEDQSPNDLAALLAAPLDWRWIERAARHQGVTPLVARRIELLTEPPRDDDAVASLLTSARANTLRNDFLSAELARLFAEFADAGIPVLALKGPVLGMIAYGDAALRVFNDLDILVLERDTPRAASLLQSLRYTAENYSEEAFISGFFDAVEANFRRIDVPIAIDLHWRLSPGSYPFGPDTEEVWDRTTEVRLGDVSIRTLGDEDHLLYVCVHASRHGWPSLSNVCDVAHLAARTDIKWTSLIERARRTRSLRMLAIGLTLANRLLGTEIPPELKAAIAPEGDSLASSVISEFLDDPLNGPGPLGEVLRSMRAIEGMLGKARYALRRLTMPTLADYDYWRLSRAMYPAFYVLRPIRIALNVVGVQARPGKRLEDRSRPVKDKSSQSGVERGTRS